MSVPDWVQDAVFYQIFPDRFANGDPHNDPPNVRPWNAAPTTWGFHGGDLRGIINHIDYLQDLGINALYLNPIFLASSNHRYNTTDYYQIDPKLGTMSDFHALLDVAHRSGIRVILDGVFNHCGRGFFAFCDVLENQEHSPYLDWFHVHNFPVDAYALGDARDYLAWWGMKSLPKFNTKNKAVRRYLFDIARYWIEQGADGWRLDVPNEIDDDAFWDEFRSIVRSVNPDAYILGEIWTADRRWVGDAHFDGLMNYPVRDAVLRLLAMGTLDIPHFNQKLQDLLAYYPRDNMGAMYVSLGTHDTERLLTKLDGDLQKARLAFSFLFAFIGAPAILYGDEIGLKGGKDPECRVAFPWEQEHWNQPLRAWVKQLIAARRSHASLRRGDLQWLCKDAGSGCVSFVRSWNGEQVIVALNPSPEARQVQIPVTVLNLDGNRKVKSLLNHHDYTIADGRIQINMPAWDGDYLLAL